MKGSDKAIVFGVLMAVVLVGFYLMVLSPKRNEASKLGKEIDGLKAQVSQQEQTAQFGEQARSQFPLYYGRLVVLGKAVPDQADTPSLLVELSTVSRRTGVKFDEISLNSQGASSATSSSSSSTPPPTSGSSGTTPSSGSSSTGSSASGTSTTPTTSGSSGTSGTSGSSTAAPAASTSAPATEASAANLPLGATVGPDSLAVMPYSLTFSGTYFQVADFIKGLDDLIHLRGNSTVAADGRLLTIDGFSLTTNGGNPSSPTLKVSVAVTSYVTPASEGLTAGASPSGPAPSVGTTPTQPASAPVSP